MRFTSCILSIFVHLLMAALGLNYSFSGKEMRIDLEHPVYEVELLQLKEKEQAAGGKQVKKETKVKKQTKSKPKKVHLAKAKDKSQAEPKKVKIPEKKPKKKTRKIEKKPKAQKKPEKAAKAKKSPKKKKPPKPTPSREQILSEALGMAKGEAQKKDKDSKDYLSRTLADLKKNAPKSTGPSRGSGAGTTSKRIYAGIVERRIKENWRFPSLSADSELKAKVRIHVALSGEIEKYELVQGSGKSEFDSSVLRAVEETKNLPKPPFEGLKQIEITFYNQDRE